MSKISGKVLAFLTADEGLNMNAVLHMTEQLQEPLTSIKNENEPICVRNSDYFEVVVPQYTNEQFNRHFRMSRSTFDKLTNVLKNYFGNVCGSFRIELEKKILVTLSILSGTQSFYNIGDKFGISHSTCHYILKEIVEALTCLMPTYIKWPEEDQYNKIAQIFEARSQGFPGTVGIIDGCHIPIKQPRGNPIDYFDRHERHSIILQGICDHTLKFIDVAIGYPGRMHDARVYHASEISSKLRQNLLPEQFHLLGDCAYPLSPYLLTPYKDNGHLTMSQVGFNIKLSNIRSTIERAFGLLKGKFRRLKYLDIETVEFGNKVIVAACVLHNFIIENNDLGDEEEEYVMEEHDIENLQNIVEVDSDIRHAGQIKRDTVAGIL